MIMDSTFNGRGGGILTRNTTEHQNGIDENLATINDEVKIIDLTQLCLEHIFMYLNLEDLLNISDANKYLKSATMVVFRRKLAGRSVKLMPGNYDCIPNGTVIMPHTITITKLKIFFQILRCYGAMITKLEFSYSEHFYQEQFENYHHILDYVNEFCAESLVSVKCNRVFGFENCKKPFTSLEDLEIRDSILNGQRWSSIFPKLRNLNFMGKIENLRLFLSDHFPNLHWLGIRVPYILFNKVCNHNADIIANENPAIIALCSNRHLKTFSISLTNYKFLQDAYDLLQTIETLHVENYFQFNSDFNVNSMHFRNVKRFELTLAERFFDPRYPREYNFFSFDSLEEFKFSISIRHYKKGIDDKELYDFLNKNRTIKKLTLRRELLIGMMSPDRLVEVLPSLNEINFGPNILMTYCPKFNINDIFSYITNNFKTVRRFIFVVEHSSNADELRKLFGQKWQIHCKPDPVIRVVGISYMIILERTET